MKRNKNLVWSFVVFIPTLILFFGCQKFLDRKPLTATLDDLNQATFGRSVKMNCFRSLLFLRLVNRVSRDFSRALGS